MNVAELVLAQQDLGSGRAGFALLVSSYGCGLIAGSLLGARDDGEAGLRRRYLGGMALMVAGLTGSALAPALGFAMFSFALTGAGDGLFILSDRVLLQRMVPERLHGRAFGVLDSVEAWGFAAAVVGGGALATAFGGRATFAIAGAGMLIVLIAASRALSSARLAIAFRAVPGPPMTADTKGAHHGPQVVVAPRRRTPDPATERTPDDRAPRRLPLLQPRRVAQPMPMRRC